MSQPEHPEKKEQTFDISVGIVVAKPPAFDFVAALRRLAGNTVRIDERPKEPLHQLVNEIRQCSDELYSVPGYSSLVDRLNSVAERLEEQCT